MRAAGAYLALLGCKQGQAGGAHALAGRLIAAPGPRVLGSGGGRSARAAGALQQTHAHQGLHQGPRKRRARRVLTGSGARARPQVDGRVIAVDLAQWVVQACEMRIEPGSQTREARCVRIAFERVRPARPRWVADGGTPARSLHFQGCLWRPS